MNTLRPETAVAEGMQPAPADQTYISLFLRFFRFGCLAFGGPVAQIAMIRRELVDEVKWIDSATFNRLLAVMQVLPGPEAHELCVHMGIRAKGRLGGVLAGLGFMLPGFLLMLGLAWLYTHLTVQAAWWDASFLGVQAAILAVIFRAVHRIGEHILLDPWLWLTALSSGAASLAGVSFWVVLPAAGAAYTLASSGRYLWLALLLSCAGAVSVATLTGPDAGVAPMLLATAPSAWALFWAGLKGGLLTFGGAYTAIPFVRNDTVGRGWMSDAQFLDGLALSGVLPAPLVIFATFAGWVSGGPLGALAITAGMFLPAFAFSLILYERLEALAENRQLQKVLSGVAAAVVGLIAVTFLDLGKAAFSQTPNVYSSASIFLGAAVIMYLWKSKLNAPFVLAMGATWGAFALG